MNEPKNAPLAFDGNGSSPPPLLHESGDVPFARPILLPSTGTLMVAADPFRLQGTRMAVWLDMGFLLAGLFAFDVLAQLALTQGAFAMGLLPRDLEESSPQLRRVILIPMLLSRTVAARILIGAILHARHQPAASVGLTRKSLGVNVAIGIGATAAAYLLIGVTLALIWLLWPQVLQGMSENARNLISIIPKLHPAMFAVMAIAIGYYEELVFRGFLMTRLRRGGGGWIPAVILSTTLFTALHAMDQTPPALVSIAILSLVFSLVTIWRKSLIPAMVAHALFDFSQLLLLYFTSGDAWK